MMIVAAIESEAGEITVEMSDYGSYWFGQEDAWVEFKVKDIQQIIAALNKILEHNP